MCNLACKQTHLLVTCMSSKEQSDLAGRSLMRRHACACALTNVSLFWLNLVKAKKLLSEFHLINNLINYSESVYVTIKSESD